MMEWKIGDLVKKGSEILKSYGSKSPRLDAELLLVHALKFKSRAEIYAKFNETVSSEEVERYKKLLARRVKGEPIAYITGKKEFLGFEFHVERGVFIPRPETELLVEVVLEKIKEKENLKVVDVGTGSGCIVLSLCKVLGEKHLFFGTDVSERALKIAEKNREKLDCRNVNFLRGNLLEPVNFSVDVVVSNPPYIPVGDKNVEKEVVKFEPAVALFGGEKGTEVVERLVKQASEKLKEEGILAVEIGINQSDEVSGILGKFGFKNIEIHKDLSGIDRVVVGVKG